MTERAVVALQLFEKGLNCAQSVLTVFGETYGVDAELAKRVAGGLGSGARSGELCGAVSGAVIVIGLKHGEDKEYCHIKTEEFIARFKEDGCIVCRDILGLDLATSSGRETMKAGNLKEQRCFPAVERAVNILEGLGY